ncbi:MAG: DNA-directed RNA polymerase subunit omega [Lachnospiraceae bacterium]|nr:DNA-directed RNA polymerase subunit omega [Lachnospiraceae bacterium]
MIHPSYVELMKVINENVEEGEEPVVNSRYSVVCATAKRARQIIDGAETLVYAPDKEKPLSIAVNEMNAGELRILTDEEALAQREEIDAERARVAACEAENKEEIEE